jgi:hypothetical protein
MPHRSIEDPTTLRRIRESMLRTEGASTLPVLVHHFIVEARLCRTAAAWLVPARAATPSRINPG